MLLSRVYREDIIETLEQDAIAYAPLCLALGVWLKHVGVPAVLPAIPALAGFLSLKIWRAFLYRRYETWRPARRVAPILLTILMLFYAIAFSILGGLRYAAFRTYGDFGLMVQQIWGFSQFKMIFLTGVGSWAFGNHFSPIFILLAPLYWIWTHPVLLYVIQNTVVALGALPVYWIARERLDSAVGGLVFAGIYLLYPAVQFPSLGDFHESLLVATPVLFAFYYLRKQAYVKAWLFMLLTLMCKEDTSLIVMMLGFYVWRVHHQRWRGIRIVAVSVIWLIVSAGFIMPMFQDGSNWYLRFFMHSAANTNMQPAITDRLEGLFMHLLTIKNLIFILQLLIPLGGLALLAPKELLIGVPTLLELMIYTGPPFGMVGTIYSWHTMAVVPAMFIAAIYGVARLMQSPRLQSFVRPRAALTPCLLFLMLSGTFAGAAYGALPYSITFRFDDFRVTPHDRIGHELLKMVPPDAPVTTTSQIYAHLSHRDEIYGFPIPFKRGVWLGTPDRYPNTVDYVVLDTSKAVVAEMTASQQQGFMEEVRALVRRPDYHTLAARDGYVILKRNADASSNADAPSKAEEKRISSP